MKVGTISLNINAPDFNYGAMLHTWAFQQYLLKKGIDTEVIDYTTPKVEGWNRYNPKKSKMNYSGSRAMGDPDLYLSRVRKFDNFIAEHLIVSDEKYTQKTIAHAELKYDVLACESDVIWAPKRGLFDPVFFLATESMREKKRVAYAPSMADATLNEEQEMQLDALLKNINFISCRESYMKPLLEKHTDKKVKHLVDPVMLLDAKDYEPITAPRILKENYMLLYLPVDENSLLREEALDYANKNGLQILEISTKLKNNTGHKETCIPDAGIEEFLSAVKYADIVFTNSFHAICFSIIFGRQFYAFTRKQNGKVEDICKLFGVEDHYMGSDEFVEKEPFDIELLHNRFMNLQREAHEWLDNALYSDAEIKDSDFDYKSIEKNFDNTGNFYQGWEKLKRKTKSKAKSSKRSVKKIGKRTLRKVSRFFKSVLRKIKSIFYSVKQSKIDKNVAIISQEYDVEPNSIAVMTINDQYSCNPKYIVEEILRRKLPYKITWFVSEDTDKSVIPKEIKTIDKYSDDAIEIAAKAKIWLNNGICFSDMFEKKDNQIYIQTMHGSLGIKRLVNSIPSRNKTKHGREVVRRECTKTDYVLTDSKFEEDVFATTFWEKTPMLRIGHARTDILFGSDENKIENIREVLLKKYGIPKEKKIVLFAPTHRKGLTYEDIEIDYSRLVNTLSKKFGGEYVVLIRLHYKTKDILDQNIEWTDELKKILYDVTDYSDIQELMLVTDVGITDYSSWIYDYLNTRHTGFIFATDLERYNDLTGLYYPLEETPFPVCKSNEQLIENVISFDREMYLKKIDEFLIDKEAMNDGHSAMRAVDLIEKCMNS